ncbi:MAG: glycosyltransferase [candidate division Zixibacteria bacterium]|nr:glycosyltransferase [candidate division Zixibacteria bacterium]
MIKIAYIIDIITSPTGGTERQLLMLMNEIDKSKFKPYLICLRDSEWLQNNDFPFDVHVLNIGRLFSLDFIKGIISFRKLYKNQKFDIIQTFFRDGNIFGSIAAKYCNCNKIISSRRNMGYWHTKFDIFLLKLFSKWTPYYLCNSKAAQEQTIEIEKVDPSKISTMYNGLDLTKLNLINDEARAKQRKIWSVKDDEIVIGAIANLRPVKNIDILIDTAAELIKEFKNLKFIVAGEGDLRKQLQEKIAKLDLVARFFLVGRTNNIYPLLSSFDIAVMPSQSESFSNSLIEYMLAKLPIVASDVGGNSEAIEHNKTGLLFSLEDKNGLLEGVKRLISDRALSRQLGKNAYNNAIRNYSISTMIFNHENYYENIASK